MSIYDQISEVRTALENPDTLRENSFEILSDVSKIVNSGENQSEARELVIRLLDMRTHLNGTEQILISLVREVGLYPYLQPNDLHIKDLFAYEFHRPEGLSRDVVFHVDQARVYRDILAGKNVILSAPTSYGKSLIIDAIIASRKFKNIVIVVPTIALIDETRRRLARFSGQVKIITHPTQEKIEGSNIFILTQERVIDRQDLHDTDFFIIDEFYKLDPHRNDADSQRSIILNHAFYKLLKITDRFYMLGPNIRSIPYTFEQRFECSFRAYPVKADTRYM